MFGCIVLILIRQLEKWPKEVSAIKARENTRNLNHRPFINKYNHLVLHMQLSGPPFHLQVVLGSVARWYVQ
jgi:hypothetical protein